MSVRPSFLSKLQSEIVKKRGDWGRERKKDDHGGFLVLCGSRKYPYPPPPPTGRLFDLHPPTPQDFPFQEIFDDPPSPQEFPEFLNGDFTYHPLEIQSGFGT